MTDLTVAQSYALMDAGMVNLVMSDGSTRPHKLVARTAPQRAIVAAA